ncbi:MAG: amino acid ABC transporter substrate-binding protein [Hyphomicrobium sp.]
MHPPIRKRRRAIAAAACLVAAAGPALAQTKTLDTVKARGALNCGVNTGLAGFSMPDDKGQWTGLDVDLCRAVAAAVFKDASKVKYVPLTAKERFTALQSGEVDMLSRNTTWTMSRDTAAGLNFVGVNYFDGQGFMVKIALGLKGAKELDGATICVQTGTTTELNVTDFFRANKLSYKPVVFEKLDETVAAYNAGRCDAFTSDHSQLYSERLKSPKPDDNVVLPDVISKEPLGPVVRQGDSGWGNVVRWTHYAMVNAEELGVTSKNVDEILASVNPEIKRLLGKEGDFGKGIGLDNDWAYQIVKLVGNYGEAFDRNVGAGSRLNIARGQNALWTKGGLQYAMPIR